MLGGWLLLVLGPALAAALPETPRFRHFTVAEGLPSSTVYRVAQDLGGHLWVATADGLARYDGVEWQVHQHRPDDPGSLPGNSIQDLLIDRQDRVWVAVEGQGVSRLGADRGAFHRVDLGLAGGDDAGNVWAMAQDGADAVWLGGFQSGVVRIDVDGGRHRYLEGLTVFALAVDGNGALWAGTAAGLFRWQGERFVAVETSGDGPQPVWSLDADEGGGVWAAGEDVVQRLDRNGRPQALPWTAADGLDMVVAIVDDGDGGHWLATRGGLVQHRDGALSARAELGMPGRPAPVLFHAFRDREGSVWFAGRGGLWQLPAGWRGFATVVPPGGEDAGPSSRLVRGVAVGGQRSIWLAANGGLDRFALDDGSIERVLGRDELPDPRLRSVLQSRDGHVWIGHHSGLLRLQPDTGELEAWGGPAIDRAPADGDVPPGPVDLLHEMDDGVLWLSAYGGGLQARAPDGGVLDTFRPGDGRGFEAPGTEGLATGPDGRLWIAGPTGLSRLDAAGTRFEAVAGGPRERVFSFAWSGERIWLHRMGVLEGFRFDGDALEPVARITVADGLPAVESGGLAIDPDGGVWLATLRGLVHQPAQGQLRTYGVRDGLPSQEFHNRPTLLFHDGVGIASTQDGLVLFDPVQARSSLGDAPLRIQQLDVRRGEQRVPLAPEASLRLRHDDRELRVVARRMSLRDPSAHRYRFRLVGHDSDWVGVGAGGERSFSRLPPGRYRLEVQATDAGGEWSPSTGLSFDVAPPWWGTLPAIAAYFLAGVLLLAWIAAAYRLRLRRRHVLELAQQRRRLAEDASQAKSEFLATLAHEVRTPLTGVLGMSELLLSGALEPEARRRLEAVQRAGEHLLRIVGDALDLARIEAGRLMLASEPFDLRATIAEACALLDPLAVRKGLDFDWRFAESTAGTVRGDPCRVRQIVLNLGTNAIKFTEQGEVAVEVGAAGEGIEIVVRDTGPGLDADLRQRLFQRFEPGAAPGAPSSDVGSGLGLAISRELAVAMGGRIDLESRPGEGACFRVWLPLQPVSALDRETVSHDEAVASGALDVLLVEDDPITAEVIAGALEGGGHRVQHARHALAALADLACRRFDVAVLDLDLPGLRGAELARLIRAHGHRLGLVAVTARADTDAEREAREAGIAGVLRKPLAAAAIRGEIERAAAPGVASKAADVEVR